MAQCDDALFYSNSMSTFQQSTGIQNANWALDVTLEYNNELNEHKYIESNAVIITIAHVQPELAIPDLYCSTHTKICLYLNHTHHTHECCAFNRLPIAQHRMCATMCLAQPQSYT